MHDLHNADQACLDMASSGNIHGARQQKTVLVVSTNPEVATTIAATLPNWKLEPAANNLAALELVQTQYCDLVVTGENTSGKDDVELLRKIRRVWPHTRLIILTNESTPMDVIASMRERAFSYFSTPISRESLAEMIRHATQEPCWDDGIEVSSATPEWIRLTARCDRKTADRLLQFFHEIIDLPGNERDNVATAFREMLLNAIEHGGRFDATQHVEISYLRAKHAVLCKVRDPGEGFSLEEIKHAAVCNPPENPLRHQAYRDAKGLRPGGFGVLITRHLVDDLIYSEQGNEVLLIKYLDTARQPTAPANRPESSGTEGD